jgi:GT2 family glycosyltransferase
MKTATIIPNWNGQDYLQACIDSLLGQTIEHTIVVVENGSVDKSDEILAGYGEKIVVLKQPKNLGFAGGVNKGIQYAIDNNYEFVALFNNDAVADKDWLNQLLITADERKAGIVTGKFLHYGDKIIDSTGDFYTIYGLPFPRGRNQLDAGQFGVTEEVFGATGGASLYRINMLKNIGLFDVDFFAYYEDVDLSFRAQLTGHKIFYEPKAVAYHHIAGTSSKINGFAVYQTAKNFWLIYLKNMPSLLFWKYLPLASYWYIRMFLAKIIRGGLLHFIKGWFAGVILLPKKLNERTKIQKYRNASTDYIDSIIIHTKPPKI